MIETSKPHSNTIITAAVPLLPAWTLTRPAEDLPAKMPRAERKLIMSRDGYPLGILDVEVSEEGVIMDEDTNPIIETPAAKYAAGETVTFNYFRDPNYSHEVYQGAIMERVFDRLCGWMYRIDPAPCAFNLSPRWISERYVRETLSVEVVANLRENDHVNALYDAMKMAEQVHSDLAKLDTFDLPADHATYKRKVAAHVAFLRAQAAYLGISNDVIIAYLYGKNALQSRQKADPSPVTASQVTASEMAETPAPLTQADGDTWLSRMRARELSFAKQTAKQWGIAPSDAPRQPAPVTVKPPRAMTPAEQANQDALQKMIDASRSFGKAE